MNLTVRPTSLGDLLITNLQAGGIYRAPHVVAPPFTLSTGRGAASWAEEPPPAGYRWDFVFDDVDGDLVRDDVNHEPVVALVEI